MLREYVFKRDKCTLTTIMFAVLSCLPQKNVYAVSSAQIGDKMQIALPIVSFLPVLFLKDIEGAKQFALENLLVQGSTHGLKHLVNTTRPNGHCCDSFPSGHTSVSFSAASFIHFRYGFKYSWPLYFAAGYVGYSRVEAQAHHVRDVVAGAVIGTLGSYLSTTAYKDADISFMIGKGSVGLMYRKIFD